MIRVKAGTEKTDGTNRDNPPLATGQCADHEPRLALAVEDPLPSVPGFHSNQAKLSASANEPAVAFSPRLRRAGTGDPIAWR
jgi:hypothetical protein